MESHKFILEPYRGSSTRHQCPACNKRREFSRYIDIDSGEYIGEEVGRCNREANCGYHYTPAMYFKDRGIMPDRSVSRVKVISRPIQYLPDEPIERSADHWEYNFLSQWLIDIAGYDKAQRIAEDYLIGSSRHWRGASFLPQIDMKGNVRQAKVMHFTRLDNNTLRRTHSDQLAERFDFKDGIYMPDIDNGDKIYFAGKRLLNDYDAHLVQCFFGEHLVAIEDKRIAIVESEKSAIIGRLYWPDYIWLATGGKNGAKWTDITAYKILAGREVVLFPDLGCFEDWDRVAYIISKNINCKIRTSMILEERASEDERSEGLDIADFILKEHGFPQVKLLRDLLKSL